MGALSAAKAPATFDSSAYLGALLMTCPTAPPSSFTKRNVAPLSVPLAVFSPDAEHVATARLSDW